MIDQTPFRPALLAAAGRYVARERPNSLLALTGLPGLYAPGPAVPIEMLSGR